MCDVGTCNFAYAHKMLAMFWGTISCRFTTAAFSTFENNRVWWKQSVAKAHTVFDNSWLLNIQILGSSTATLPSISKSSESTARLFANAHNVLEISWVFNSEAVAFSSAARISKTTGSRRSAVAKAQAMVDRHWPLNSFGARVAIRCRALSKRFGGTSATLAYAQSKFDNSNDFSASNLAETISAMASKSRWSRMRIVAQDHVTMLMHGTGISQPSGLSDFSFRIVAGSRPCSSEPSCAADFLPPPFAVSPSDRLWWLTWFHTSRYNALNVPWFFS
mmetsp:Transcript_126308/g.404332  ORF Transcript_126308/g.404332 Transcript_126308/m.404332 type:complete len:276 (-) Transcript_126308:1220-2047(-)